MKNNESKGISLKMKYKDSPLKEMLKFVTFKNILRFYSMHKYCIFWRKIISVVGWT